MLFHRSENACILVCTDTDNYVNDLWTVKKEKKKTVPGPSFASNETTEQVNLKMNLRFQNSLKRWCANKVCLYSF